MRGFNVAGDLIVSLLCGLADGLSLPHEFVPINAARAALAAPTARLVRAHFVAAAFVDTDFTPRFDRCFLPLPIGRPPSLPHSRILATNSRLPHRLIRTCALRRPIRLAAFFTVVIHHILS
jgi:hypothetical protein